MNRSSQAYGLVAWIVALSPLLAGCASMPPGADYPKIASTALADPASTPLGQGVEALAKAHPGLSGFRLFASGSDAFTLRVQMANRAQRTLDVQYFIFKADTTGKPLMGAILPAASRVVRVRIRMDDSQARGEDARRATLVANA